MGFAQFKEVVRKALGDHRLVQVKLNQKELSMRDLQQIAGIKRGQLNYWGLHDALVRQEKKQKRTWRRFSRLDLMGFGILNAFSEHGMRLTDLHETALEWLTTAIDKFNLLEQFTIGNRVYIYLNRQNIEYFYGNEPQVVDRIYNKIILPMESPVTFLCIDPIMRKVLKQTQNADFSVKFVKDRFGGNNKIIYYIEGMKIILGKLSKRKEKRG